MKHIGTIALLISLAITGYLLWDTRQQLSSSQDDVLQFAEAADRSAGLALAALRYINGTISHDSLIKVHDYYDDYMDSVSVQWEER